jgi:hypothetical protein
LLLEGADESGGGGDMSVVFGTGASMEYEGEMKQSIGMVLTVSIQKCREASCRWEFWRVRDLDLDWGCYSGQVACFACKSTLLSYPSFASEKTWLDYRTLLLFDVCSTQYSLLMLGWRGRLPRAQ